MRRLLQALARQLEDSLAFPAEVELRAELWKTETEPRDVREIYSHLYGRAVTEQKGEQ